MRRAHGVFSCSPQEFQRPLALEAILIRFWGGSADPKNTSRTRQADFSPGPHKTYGFMGEEEQRSE